MVLGTSPVAMISSSYARSLPSASVTVCAAVSTERAPLPRTHGDVVLLVELGRLQRDVVHLGAQHFL